MSLKYIGNHSTLKIRWLCQSPEFIETDDPNNEEEGPKKESGSSNKRKLLQKPHNLKKNQGHQSLLVTQVKRNRNLEKHQTMKKRPPQRQEKKLKRPHILKKYQNYQGLLIQNWMTQVLRMNKGLQLNRPKKYENPKAC